MPVSQCVFLIRAAPRCVFNGNLKFSARAVEAKARVVGRLFAEPPHAGPCFGRQGA